MKLSKSILKISLLSAALLSASFVNAAEIRESRAKLSHPMSKDNPIALASDKFAELVSEKSGDKIKIRTYPSAQLGSETQAMSSAQGGTIDFAVVSTASVASVVKDYAVFDLPFLFANEKEVDAVIDSDLGQNLLKQLSNHNLVGLCYFDYGFRQVTNSKHPINKLEDFKGLKIRTLQNRVYLDIFTALGATPMPLPFPETYTALETKAIDGQESAYQVTNSSSYQDIQSYLTETRHVFLPAVVVASKRYWDRLNDDERNIITTSCKEAEMYHRDISRKAETEVVEKLIKAGMKFNQIEPSEKERMVQAVAPVVDKYKNEFNDLYPQMMSIIEKVRSGQ